MGAAETHKNKKRNDHDHKKHNVANKPHPTREKKPLVWNNTSIHRCTAHTFRKARRQPAPQIIERRASGTDARSAPSRARASGSSGDHGSRGERSRPLTPPARREARPRPPGAGIRPRCVGRRRPQWRRRRWWRRRWGIPPTKAAAGGGAGPGRAPRLNEGHAGNGPHKPLIGTPGDHPSDCQAPLCPACPTPPPPSSSQQASSAAPIHPPPPTASPRTGSRGKRAEGLKKRTPNSTGQMQKKKKNRAKRPRRTNDTQEDREADYRLRRPRAAEPHAQSRHGGDGRGTGSRRNPQPAAASTNKIRRRGSRGRWRGIGVRRGKRQETSYAVKQKRAHALSATRLCKPPHSSRRAPKRPF